MNKSLLFLLLATSFLLSSSVSAREIRDGENHAEISPVQAGLPTEARLAFDRAVAPIKNDEELVEFMASANSEHNPLRMLSDEALRTFIGSLSFGPQGLASFNSAVLERELTATETYALLELFGFQEAVSTLRNQRSKTSLDSQLNFYCDTSGIGWNQCDDSPYVEGMCFGQGTCENSPDFTCHPPSCGDMP